MCLYTHTRKHNRILSSHKKKKILPFVTTWVNFEGIMLSGISQTEKNKYCMISLICSIYLVLLQQEQEQQQVYRDREQIAGCQK